MPASRVSTQPSRFVGADRGRSVCVAANRSRNRSKRGVLLTETVIHDGHMDHEALTRMQEAAAPWSVGRVTAPGLVDAECDLLVAGFDVFGGVSTGSFGESAVADECGGQGDEGGEVGGVAVVAADQPSVVHEP
jgi:hypothetical protein